MNAHREEKTENEDESPADPNIESEENRRKSKGTKEGQPGRSEEIQECVVS